MNFTGPLPENFFYAKPGDNKNKLKKLMRPMFVRCLSKKGAATVVISVR